jgi:hypothetical protein
MKKLLFIWAVVFIFANCSYSAGYCPTPNEFQDKMQYFQAKALRLMHSNPSVTTAEDLMKEQNSYLNSVFPGCMQYFETTSAPDCIKLQTLSTSYIMLDKSKKSSAKARINSLPYSLQSKCPVDYKVMKIFIED